MMMKKGPQGYGSAMLNLFTRPQATWWAVLLKSHPDVLFESLVVVFRWLIFNIVRP